MSTKVFLPLPRFRRYSDALRSLGAEVCFTEIARCDALLLPGGPDVDPARYGQPNRASLGIDPARDALEFSALETALALHLPVLGICRGCQLLNAAFGGTLHQDICGHSALDENTDRLHPSHTTDPMLIALYGEDFIVNSSHHQAVDRLGEGLRAVQWGPDGVIEAIRHERLPVFAVQWHPERLRWPTDGHRLLALWLRELQSAKEHGEASL